MPLDEALAFVSADFGVYMKALRTGVEQPSLSFLLNLLVSGKHLGPDELDCIIQHVNSRRQKLSSAPDSVAAVATSLPSAPVAQHSLVAAADLRSMPAVAVPQQQSYRQPAAMYQASIMPQHQQEQTLLSEQRHRSVPIAEPASASYAMTIAHQQTSPSAQLLHRGANTVNIAPSTSSSSPVMIGVKRPATSSEDQVAKALNELLASKELKGILASTSQQQQHQTSTQVGHAQTITANATQTYAVAQLPPAQPAVPTDPRTRAASNQSGISASARVHILKLIFPLQSECFIINRRCRRARRLSWARNSSRRCKCSNMRSMKLCTSTLLHHT